MNLNDFEEHISPEIIDRGYDYFISECVDGLEEVASGMWLAEVHGSEIYTVEVNTKRKKIEGWDCDCPYDYGPVCKHVVAVIYAIAEKMEHDKKQKPASKGKKPDKDKVRKIGEKVSREDLWCFILDLFKTDRSIKNRFIAHFAELLDEDPTLKYKTIVRNYYKAAQGRHGFIDYRSASQLTKPLYELAEKAADLLAEGNKIECLAICKSLIEEVPVFIHNMDDSDGGAGDIVFLAFDTLTQLAETAPPMLKDELFDYVIVEFSKQKYHDFGFEDHFLDLLPNLISSEEQEAKFMAMVDRQIETENEKSYSHYAVSRLKKTKVDYLLQNQREEEAFALIEEDQHLPDFREILIDRAISKKDYETAKNYCNEGIGSAREENLYGNIQRWQVKLHAIAKLEGNTPDQRKWSEKLFFGNHYNMEWYRELKSTWPNQKWAEPCEELIIKIKGQNKRGWYGEADALARIFVEENYKDRLLKLLQLNSGNIQFVEQYSQVLWKQYPGELLELYTQGISESIKQTGRKQYRQVAAYLRKMKNLKGGDERVYALLKQFLNEYSNRPAMKEEFRKAFPDGVKSIENKTIKQETGKENNNTPGLF